MEFCATVKNGAEVLTSCPLNPESTEGIVLCAWRSDFVTWRVDAEGNTYSGHFFNRNDFSAAVADYEFRAGITSRAANHPAVYEEDNK